MRTPLQELVRKYGRAYLGFSELQSSDPNRSGLFDDTLWHVVASVGTLGEVDLLMDAGADINFPGGMGETPLHSTIRGGKLEMVRRLLALGADPGLRGEFGDTAAEKADILVRPEIAALIGSFNKAAKAA